MIDQEPLQRAGRAPAPRTLVDVFDDTVADHPDSPALDNGSTVLTYSELADATAALAEELREAGIGPGDKVGVRVGSGTTDLYVAILGILQAGAAYVPVDADDPDTRARLVFDEAHVAAVIGRDLVVSLGRLPASGALAESRPEPGDDAWVIFTSGSTGKPKGVAVSHRSAAAFVDAEARMFLQDAPIGERDRVMAGLSVAFDASCEEMWLAWRYGACLVPVPRSLVRSGVDLGPWLTANDVTIVSTVPTLVALWPLEALDSVRLLILGGEACSPELAGRLATPEREVWNTYGPTEATVVSCGARVDGSEPVRIGLPLDGWDLAVVGENGERVVAGEEGELIIGGVGLARYLDPAKDAERYAPMASLGWERAYRSGDLVEYHAAGLTFVGRADEQIKLGGRRIELGEIDHAIGQLPGVIGAAAAVRTSRTGNQLLVGYAVVDDTFDPTSAAQALRESLPAALVPRLATVESLPTRTSGKIDRDALPWPLESAGAVAEANELVGTAGWLSELWAEILGSGATGESDDFFDVGGGSLSAAQLVSRLRTRFPDATVAHVYEHPTIGGLAAVLDAMESTATVESRQVRPAPVTSRVAQVLLTIPLRTLAGLRWLVWIALIGNVAAEVVTLRWWTPLSWPLVLLGWFLLITPVGKIALSVLAARLTLAGVRPGTYRRGGATHLRVWFAERAVDELGAHGLAGATFLPWYARMLGAKVGKMVDLHSIPPVTGMLTVGNGAAIELEVDLAGHWLDGDRFHLGEVVVGSKARVGARSTLAPGAVVGAGAEIGPGSAVLGEVPDKEFWSGAPARRIGPARGPWDKRPTYHPAWTVAYSATSVAIACLPLLAGALVGIGYLRLIDGTSSLGDAVAVTAAWMPVGVVVAFVLLAALVLASTRLLGLGLAAGPSPVHSRTAWQAWSIVRLLDDARTWLFPLYASTFTPMWMRLLGARIGSDVEISTAVLIPPLTSVGDGAFLADDTMIGSYELGGGWLRIDRAKIGKRAFVGNSGMTAPGRKVPKQGLVAVLSAAPRRSKAKAGTSWLGSPPVKLRREVDAVDTSRTYAPATRLRVARALVEVCRLISVVAAAATAMLLVWALLAVADAAGWTVAAVVSGLVLTAVGAGAAAFTSLVKWILVGRIKPVDHPLWSSFVWRNELADTFVEVVAAPWFARVTTGTPLLNLWLRTLGARVGRGVWCDTYWLPEADLIDLGDGATVNRGCVVQTHLFHDRVLSMDRVRLRTGATIGPNSVILPAADIGRHATVGPVSLVMRGESVPSSSHWIGNPIEPWSAGAGAG